LTVVDNRDAPSAEKDSVTSLVEESSSQTVLLALEPGETVRTQTRGANALLALTEQRLLVAEGQRLALSLGFEELRRIEFDVERNRPATLIIVPDKPSAEPVALSIPPEEIPAASKAIAVIGRRLARLD
jgi:hypothetical protein